MKWPNKTSVWTGYRSVSSQWLLGHRDPVPTGNDGTYEVKWDGIRAIVIVDEGVVRIKTRSLRDVAFLHDSPGTRPPVWALGVTSQSLLIPVSQMPSSDR